MSVERGMAVSSEYEFFLSRTICMTSFFRATPPQPSKKKKN